MKEAKQMSNKPVITPKPAVKIDKPATATKSNLKKNSLSDVDSEHVSGTGMWKNTEEVLILQKLLFVGLISYLLC